MKVFLSYSRSDRPFAQRLKSHMTALGVDVFSDENAMPAGESWQTVLREALESADGIVLVPPQPGAPGANSAYFEAGAARALGKSVVAVLPNTDKKRMHELPAEIAETAVLDGSSEEPASLATKIVAALRAA